MDNEDTVNNNSKEGGFTNSAYGSKILQEGDKKSDEENENYVVENNVAGEQRGNKNISKITSTTKSICTYKIKTDII